MKNKINFISNRLLLNYEYCRKKTCLGGYPVEITIELTNNCNLNCIFCPHHKMQRKKGFIDFSLFKEIVDQISGFVECVDLDLMGESTLHPKIFEIIQYCKKNGLKTALNSNMTKVNKQLAKTLIDAGLDILVMSIDGINKDTYESIRPGALFSETKQNIKNLLSLDAEKLYKVVQMVYISNNKDEIKQFFLDWKNENADFIRIQPYQNIDKENISLNAMPSGVKRSRKACIQPWKKMAVCWDGTVVLCCNDYDKFSVIGDIRKEKIFSIWNSLTLQDLRRKIIEQNWENLTFCRDCFPFQPNKILLWGSSLVNPIEIRRLLFFFEKLMILNNICFFRYF